MTLIIAVMFAFAAGFFGCSLLSVALTKRAIKTLLDKPAALCPICIQAGRVCMKSFNAEIHDCTDANCEICRKWRHEK